MWFFVQSFVLMSGTSYLSFKPFTIELPRKKANWCFSSVIVDNTQPKINTLRYWHISTMCFISLFQSQDVWILRVSCMCMLVWHDARIFLCFWHVQKAWAENAIKKISTVGECVVVLHMVGGFMYGNECSVNNDSIDLAPKQIDIITTSRPRSTTFMRYMNDNWKAQAAMWYVGARRIPHVGQNTIATIKSYHLNLKAYKILQKNVSLQDAWINSSIIS